MSLQDFDGSLETIAQGEKIFSKSPQLELLRGIAYYGQRRFPEAVDAFLRSAELGPTLEQPHAFLGRILSHAHGRLDRVTARFAAFAAVTPESFLSQYLYAAALLEGMGPAVQPEVAGKAEELLRRSIERKGDFADSHFELGVLLAKKRDFEGAEKHLERSAALNPKSSKTHYHLSRVYTRLGKNEQAEAERALHEKLTEEERQAMRSGMASETQPALGGMIR
jgi:tetratricopeptide (TPR) repeat protein